MAQDKPRNKMKLDAEQTLAVVSKNRKFSKASSVYKEPGDVPRETCGGCRFYLRDPKGKELGGCQVVEGEIAWFGTSDLFISALGEAEAILKSRESKQVAELIKEAGKDRSKNPGVMINYRIPDDVSRRIKKRDGEPMEQLHMTVAYLGKLSDIGIDNLPKILKAAKKAAMGPMPQTAKISGVGAFKQDDEADVIYASVDAPGLAEFRSRLMAQLDKAGVSAKKDHDFTPHITLAYSPERRSLYIPRKIKGVEFDLGSPALNIGNFSMPIQRDFIPPTGPENPPAVFVSGSPGPDELASGDVLNKEDGQLFKSLYLDLLGFPSDQVSTMYAVPVETRCKPEEFRGIAKEWEGWRDSEIEKMGSPVVITLGKAARDAMGDHSDFSLPHPAAISVHGDNGEVLRKMRAIRAEVYGRIFKEEKQLDFSMPSDSFSKQSPEGDSTSAISRPGNQSQDSEALSVKICKIDTDQRIAYGVVATPYVIGDSQGHWFPAADIQKFAHGFFEKSRTPGFRHRRKMNAAFVESWVVHYPTLEDERKAHRNEPHNAYVIPFGDGVIRSGEWLAGERYDDPKEWQAVKDGELDSFSVGLPKGAILLPSSETEAPEVTFIKLKAA